MGERAAQAMAHVANRTYYRQGETWVVSTYDEQRHKDQLVRVRFGSDEYFALAQQHPELAAAFALGPRVIAEAEGKFYEVTAE